MLDGLLLGGREAKFFISHPVNKPNPEAYEIRIFRYVNDEFMIYEECSLSGFTRWLISRNRNPTDEELQKIIASENDLKRLDSQKFCAI
ncbi:hypothetical protein RR48_05996 [Papilio machaon]|uniref:Uncharacterized protein n=1 Tax=Papilio machaon TaxID=76193 RepID=A0A194RJC2_PAPMA|nr:hypothetical protein RR48_05996 [Papilio machaon]